MQGGANETHKTSSSSPDCIKVGMKLQLQHAEVEIGLEINLCIKQSISIGVQHTKTGDNIQLRSEFEMLDLSEGLMVVGF